MELKELVTVGVVHYFTDVEMILNVHSHNNKHHHLDDHHGDQHHDYLKQ